MYTVLLLCILLSSFHSHTITSRVGRGEGKVRRVVVGGSGSGEQCREALWGASVLVSFVLSFCILYLTRDTYAGGKKYGECTRMRKTPKEGGGLKE